MVLARLRRSSRAIAVLLLASFWGLSHRASDDACMARALEAHDESKHVVGAPDGAEPAHCAVCHSIRTPKRPFGPGAHLHSPFLLGALVQPLESASRRAPALDRLPARAPPSSLT
jgi:hypothetical protein